MSDLSLTCLSTCVCFMVFFFFSSRRRHTRFKCDWSSDVCSSDLSQHNQDVLAQMAKIDRASLSPADQLNYDLFRKGFQESLEGYKFHRFLLRLNQREGIHTTAELAESLRFETLKDYQDSITRLRKFPALMGQ